MTVQEFIGRNPDSTLNLMTPSGYLTLTPELSKSLLQGKSVYGHAGTDEARQLVPADQLLYLELVTLNPHKTIPRYYGAIADDHVPIQELKRLETIDLSYCVLIGKDFTGYHFDGANLRGTRFENVNFQNAVFLNCDLSEARFANCQLDNAVLVNDSCYVTLFDDCSVSGMRMKSCDMEGAEACGFDITDIQMDDATLDTIPELREPSKTVTEGNPQRIISQKELELMGAKHVMWLYGEGGEQADFSGCRLTKLDMRHMNFNGAIFNETVFEDVDLSSANLCHAMFEKAKFTYCILYCVIARESNYRCSVFEGCDLRHGMFTGSNLTDVEVSSSNLQGMNVQNCCLENSDIQNHTGMLNNCDTAFLSEGDWMQNQQDGMLGMGGMT